MKHLTASFIIGIIAWKCDYFFDPLGRPTIKFGIDHYNFTHVNRIWKSLKAKQFLSGIVIATGGIVGLAERIIDDTCLVNLLIPPTLLFKQVKLVSGATENMG